MKEKSLEKKNNIKKKFEEKVNEQVRIMINYVITNNEIILAFFELYCYNKLNE